MYLRLICLWLLLLILISCGDRGEGSAPTLLYWTSNNGGELKFAAWAVEKWNSGGKGQKVVAQPIPEGQSSEEILLAAVVAGTTPDVYSNIWQGLVEFYSRSGVLVAYGHT